MRRGRDRCNGARAQKPVSVRIATASERHQVLTAVSGLLIDMANRPGGAHPNRLVEMGRVASEVACGAPVVWVPQSIAAGLRARLDES
jgi:hypothetical protein